MQNPKPAWWQLYLLFPIMFGLLAVEQLSPLPGISPKIIDGAIVLLPFAAMLLWVHVNEGALQWYYLQKDKAAYNLKITVYEPASKTKTEDEGSDTSKALTQASPEDWLPEGRTAWGGNKDKWSLN